jgi:hypothetical protein
VGKEKRVKRRLVQFGVVLAIGSVAVLLGAKLAVATIPDANGMVHGCVKSDGSVYLIDPSAGQKCYWGTPLDWNETGAIGPQGSDGPKGATGLQGTTGSSGYEKTYDQETTDSNGNGSAEADCPSGKVAIAGGYELSGPKAMVPLHSAPASDGSGWVVDVADAPSQTFTAYAICAANGGS